MKTSKSIDSLCSFLEGCDVSLKAVSRYCYPITPENMASKYLAECLRRASERKLASRIILPAYNGNFSFREDKVTHSVIVQRRGIDYTRLDAVVFAGLPALVEMRTTAREDVLGRYFRHAHKKHDVMSALYRDDFAHILIVPSSFGKDTVQMAYFKQQGGKIAAVHYSSGMFEKAA